MLATTTIYGIGDGGRCLPGHLLAKQPPDAPAPDADTQELLRLFNVLQHENPELARGLSPALVRGIFGAMLHWPGSARFFDQTGPTIVAEGQREVTAAGCVSRLRGRPLVDIGRAQPVPVMA